LKQVEKYIVIKNFAKFQHYKNRNPPWIRLYFALLNDKDFYRLPDAHKFHVMGLFLIASQNDNKIPLDKDWLVKQLASTEPLDLDALVASTFIEIVEQVASKALAKRKRVAAPETETEKIIQKTETDADMAPAAAGVPVAQDLKPKLLHQIWTEEHGSLPAFRDYTDGIRRKCEARMNSHRLDLATFVSEFRAAVIKARESPFLRGENESHWKADLTWFLKNDENFRKVLSGKYDGARKTKSQSRTDQRNAAAQSALSDYLAEDLFGNVPPDGQRRIDQGEDQVVCDPLV
jgi:hypothetical protein